MSPQGSSKEPLWIAGARLFTGRMPFLSPSQQCHSTEWIFSVIITSCFQLQLPGVPFSAVTSDSCCASFHSISYKRHWISLVIFRTNPFLTLSTSLAMCKCNYIEPLSQLNYSTNSPKHFYTWNRQKGHPAIPAYKNSCANSPQRLSFGSPGITQSGSGKVGQ